MHSLTMRPALVGRFLVSLRSAQRRLRPVRPPRRRLAWHATCAARAYKLNLGTCALASKVLVSAACRLSDYVIDACKFREKNAFCCNNSLHSHWLRAHSTEVRRLFGWWFIISCLISFCICHLRVPILIFDYFNGFFAGKLRLWACFRHAESFSCIVTVMSNTLIQLVPMTCAWKLLFSRDWLRSWVISGLEYKRYFWKNKKTNS